MDPFIGIGLGHAAAGSGMNAGERANLVIGGQGSDRGEGGREGREGFKKRMKEAQQTADQPARDAEEEQR